MRSLITLLSFALSALAQQQFQLRIGGNNAGAYTNGYVKMIPSGANNALAIVDASSENTFSLDSGVLQSASMVSYYGYVSGTGDKAPINFGGTKDSAWGNSSDSTYTYLSYKGINTFAICNTTTVNNVLLFDRKPGDPYNGSPCIQVVVVLVAFGSSSSASSSASVASVASASVASVSASSSSGAPASGSSASSTTSSSTASKAAPASASASITLAAAAVVPSSTLATAFGAGASVNVNVNVAVTVQATALTQVVPCDCTNGYTSVVPNQVVTITKAGRATVVYGVSTLAPVTITQQGGAVTTVVTAPCTVTKQGGTVTTITLPASGPTLATFVPQPTVLLQANAGNWLRISSIPLALAALAFLFVY